MTGLGRTAPRPYDTDVFRVAVLLLSCHLT